LDHAGEHASHVGPKDSLRGVEVAPREAAAEPHAPGNCVQPIRQGGLDDGAARGLALELGRGEAGGEAGGEVRAAARVA
jgi:hypothetical protein